MCVPTVGKLTGPINMAGYSYIREEESSLAKEKRAEQCYRIIFEALEKGGGIEKIIKTIACGLQVPIVIVDPYGKNIVDAYTLFSTFDAGGRKEERAAWIHMIEEYYAKEFEKSEADINPAIVCRRDAGSRILGAVMVKGGLEGFCISFHESEDDGRFINQLVCQALSICFGQKDVVYTVKDSGARQIISKLLLGNGRDMEYMPKVGDDIYEAYVVPPFLLVLIEAGEKKVNLWQIRSRLSEKYQDALIYMGKNRLTVLFVHVDSEDKKEHIRAYLNQLMENAACVCSISEPFEQMGQIQDKCKIAQRVIRIGCRLDPEENIYTEYRYYMELVCSYAYEAIGASGCFQKELELLECEDREKGTEFYKSLKEYLLTGNNVNLAAKNLFIHRNTMVYRLAKIHKITNLDVNDHEIARRLMLSMLLRTFI